MVFNHTLAREFQKAGFLIFPLYRSAVRAYAESKGWQRFDKGLPADGRTTASAEETPATSDPALLVQWSKNKAVIGYGICAPDHIIFDLDVKKGKQGPEEFEKLRDKYQIPKPGLVVKTKSGGYHLFYKREDELQAALIAKAVDFEIAGDGKYVGVDIIANNGYVVGPEFDSNTEWKDGTYCFLKGNIKELTACPSLPLYGQVRQKTAAGLTTGADLIIPDADDDTESLLAIIRAGNIPDVVPAGNRDNLLAVFLGILKQKKIPKDTARILGQKFIENCELTDTETLETFTKSCDLDGKLNRFFDNSGDLNDPRTIAREIIINAGIYKCLEQLPGSMAIIATRPNPYMEPFVTYNDTKARQDLMPYAKAVPGSDSNKVVNPLDIIMRDASVPRVHSTGYFPRAIETFIEPADGTERVNTYQPPKIGRVLKSTDIVRQVEDLALDLCGDLTNYMLDFMAHIVQKPASKMGVAILLISVTQGTGKNTLIQVMKPVIGPKNYLSVAGITPLVEDKSTILEGNILIVFNEVARPSNRSQWTDMSKAVNKIKTSITDGATQINPKYEKQRKITSYSNMVMLSNDSSPFDLGSDDRRFVVINNDPPKMDKDGKYKLLGDYSHFEKTRLISQETFDSLTAELHSYFMSREITHNLEHGSAPMSTAKMAMMDTHYAPPITAFRELRQMGGLGMISDVTCEDKIIFIIRHVLGFKQWGNDRAKYDIWQPFITAGIIKRVYQRDGKRTRVLTGCPSLIDREDFPILAPVNKAAGPQKVFIFCDSDKDVDVYSDGMLREEVWRDIDSLKGHSGKDALALIK